MYIDQPVRKDNLHDQTPYKYLLDTLLYVYQQQGTGDTVKKSYKNTTKKKYQAHCYIYTYQRQGKGDTVKKVIKNTTKEDHRISQANCYILINSKERVTL